MIPALVAAVSAVFNAISGILKYIAESRFIELGTKRAEARQEEVDANARTAASASDAEYDARPPGADELLDRLRPPTNGQP